MSCKPEGTRSDTRTWKEIKNIEWRWYKFWEEKTTWKYDNHPPDHVNCRSVMSRRERLLKDEVNKILARCEGNIEARKLIRQAKQLESENDER